MTREQIKYNVLSKLDEITSLDEFQQVPTVGLIDTLMDESTISMLRNAPLHLLPSVKINVTSLTLNHYKNMDDGTGYVGLPDDFLRLYRFKMAAWQRTATEAISIHNPKYKLQSSKHTRGGLVKPVVAINQLSVVNDGISFTDPDVLETT